MADRAEATREAVRSAPQGRTIQPGIGLARADETMLALRAERLLARVRLRSPAVDYLLAVAGGLTWFGRVALVLAFIVGLSLSTLDGSRRINILAFPLIGLIAWNFFIYTLLIAFALGGLSDLWAELMKASGAAERIFQLMDRTPAIPLEGGAEGEDERVCARRHGVSDIREFYKNDVRFLHQF